jgi:hypothetical protein
VKTSRVLHCMKLMKDKYPLEFAKCTEEGLTEIEASLLLQTGRFWSELNES